MRIGDVMTKPVIGVSMDDSLQRVRGIFQTHAFHHVPVVEHGQVRGLVSDRDLLAALSPYLDTGAEQLRDLRTLDRKVHQVMRRDFASVEVDATLESAAESLLAHDHSCLLVTGPQGRLVGIATWRDLLRRCMATLQN